MRSARQRLARERKTFDAMIALFCRAQHACPDALCADCAGLLAYAHLRLDKCPYGELKPTCVKCPIHCYKPALRERMKVVMRYAGPRMLLHHPVLAIRHMIDERQPAPDRPPRRANASSDFAGADRTLD